MSARRVLAILVAAGGLAASPARAERIHVVQPGETLWTIAGEAIGDASLWPALYRANRDQIADPRILHPGQRLQIPALEPESREELRREARSLLPR